jgi:hypothetical protein
MGMGLKMDCNLKNTCYKIINKESANVFSSVLSSFSYLSFLSLVPCSLCLTYVNSSSAPTI